MKFSGKNVKKEKFSAATKDTYIVRHRLYLATRGAETLKFSYKEPTDDGF